MRTTSSIPVILASSGAWSANARALEVKVEVLSADAVRMAPGTRVLSSRWGGDQPLEGRVRVVEPRGFTKMSALGVEEQPVRVIADLKLAVEILSGLKERERMITHPDDAVEDGKRVVARA